MNVTVRREGDRYNGRILGFGETVVTEDMDTWAARVAANEAARMAEPEMDVAEPDMDLYIDTGGL